MDTDIWIMCLLSEINVLIWFKKIGAYNDTTLQNIGFTFAICI